MSSVSTHSHQFLGIHLQALAIAFAPRLQLPWWKVDLYRTRRELATWTQMDTAKYNVTTCNDSLFDSRISQNVGEASMGSLLFDDLVMISQFNCRGI